MKISNIMIIFICLLILFSGTVSAKQLTVKKVLMNTDIKTGDSVSISLEFDNPFNKSIPVIIQDNNVLGNNGLEIQCYEYSLPDIPRTSISYDFPIQAYSPGEFTLDPAIVSYTDPESGTQEFVRSEQVKISIKPGQSTGQLQGITKIYNCGGMSMQSTSISSSGSTSISISSGSQQTNQDNNVQPPASPENIQQGAQNMQNIKQEMEKQQQEQQKMEKELKERIESNETFRQMNRTLLEKGFDLSSRNIDLKTNVSSFEYSYNDQQGRNASITGNVTDSGEIKDMMLQEPEPLFPYWIFFLLLVPLIGIYLYARSRNKGNPVEPVKENILIDPKENALSMLENAINMFNNGRQKEAYMEASNAVRSYFKGTSGINELTSEEILRSVRGTKDEGYLQDLKEFFMLCDLVKFAKYEPNAQDFNRVVDHARSIIDQDII
jgi:hypothetical protein